MVRTGDQEAFYRAIKTRLLEELPGDARVLALLTARPELRVEVERQTVTMDTSTLKGRIARFIAAGFYDSGKTNGATRKELARTGPDANNANIANALNELTALGFLTREAGETFAAVPGMKVNVVEK